jgi:hypothetical protein
MYLDGRGAVSGRDSAALWGADVIRLGAPIEVTVPVETRLRAPRGLAVVRSPLPAGDVTSWAGIPVTTPGRTAFDLARRQSLTEAVVCVDAMLAARLIAVEDLQQSARVRPGWTGLPQLNKALMLCDGNAESPQESRLRLILVAYEGDHHRGRGAYQSDLRRINSLRTCGWTVLRFVAADMREPARIARVVREALSRDAG